jgi:hypothetical protein
MQFLHPLPTIYVAVSYRPLRLTYAQQSELCYRIFVRHLRYFQGFPEEMRHYLLKSSQLSPINVIR